LVLSECARFGCIIDKRVYPRVRQFSPPTADCPLNVFLISGGRIALFGYSRQINEAAQFCQDIRFNEWIAGQTLLRSCQMKRRFTR
jgi:hypothetical protein